MAAAGSILIIVDSQLSFIIGKKINSVDTKHETENEQYKMLQALQT